MTSIPHRRVMIRDNNERHGAHFWQFDEWEGVMQALWNGALNIHVEKEKRRSFIGSARLTNLFGLPAMDHMSSEVRLERTARHVRTGTGSDDYAISLQLTGKSIALQNDRVVKAAPGDLSLLDAARAGQRVEDGRTFGFNLSRQVVVSHLGYEPQGGLLSRGALAGRLLFQMAEEVIKCEQPAPLHGNECMQIAVCGLFCAAFARPKSDLRSASRHTEKLFDTICSIIRDSAADPNLTPSKVAAEAGISLRYLQRLFTPKGTTCIHFINALRLDCAARLLHRRAIVGGKQTLNEVATASGFRDYTHFSRKFRDRFGCVPSAYARKSETR
jgi:AraC family transcriptional regulator, positive regulator of tynA and feaB